MIRIAKTLLLSLLLSLGLFAADEAKAPETTPQTKCPIKGGDINKDVFVDYQGKRVYFCCAGCDKKFMANADTLIKAAEAKGITFEAAPQTMCPVSDEEIDTDIFVEKDGKKTYFCCKKCLAKFKASPDEYLKKLNAPAAAATQATEKKADHDKPDHDKGEHKH